MKKNRLKSAFQKSEQAFGCWVTLSDPLVPQILAPAGFDFLVVDMEHSSIELRDLLPLVMSIEANGMVPLVRVGENDPNLIKRVMDAGAYGVIVANVCSREEAERAVSAVKYPPIGTRGVGLYRAQEFGKKFTEYLDWVRDESIVVIQIEHINAVNDIESIFSTPGIDAYMIGPYDLSGSLGKPGQFDEPDVKAAIQKTLDAAKAHGIVPGFHSVASDPALAAQRAEQGYRFLAFSLDSIFMGDAAIRAMSQLKK